MLAVGALACLAALPFARTEERTPCAQHEPLRRAWFGDLHVHTVFSLDASTQGTRNRPADAYRFARGERLGIQPYDAAGRPLRSLKLARPLDFAAVTDHAELLGEWHICNAPGAPGYDSWVCWTYRHFPRVAYFVMNTQASRAARFDFCGPAGENCLEAARIPWREIRDAAESAYDRSEACGFTSFIGYEWTGAAGSGVNFHRNVIFRNTAVPELPTSYIDAPALEALWARLRSECTEAETGCDAVVIPHNSNLSSGRMFQTVRPDGSPITADDARARARFEVLVEVMQHKGDSECMLSVDAEDELCDFEKLETSSFTGQYVPWLNEPPVPRMFVRNALGEGLLQEQRLGANPFKFGIVASSDTHLGAPGAVDEAADYPGHGGAGTPAGEAVPTGFPDMLDFNPGGLAVLWAEENSRDALFAAMQRREVYGTSGPRILVRLFAGWSYPDDLCQDPGFAAAGYAGGVPMGGDLSLAPTGRAPRLAVRAERDARSAQLERLQVVKLWVDGDATHERVYDIAGNPPGRASVELDTCRTHGAGFDRLCAVWEDPDFDPTAPATYYARVVENPTCRWSQRLCNARGVRCDDPASIAEGLEACCAPEHRAAIQERAWTSPVWYQPR